MSLFGGSIVGSALGPFGSIVGAAGDAGRNLFGTQQGTIPYNSSFNNTSSSSPWAPAAPYLTSGLGYAQNVYNANNAPGSLFNLAQNQAQQTLSGSYLDPSSNPFLKSSVQDALGLAGSAFAGQYGGQAGNNLENSGYQEGLARNLGQIATNAFSNAYQQERQNQVSAIPFGSTLPYGNLAGYEGAISPALAFNTATSSGTGTQQQPYFVNNTANTLGVLAGAAGLGKMFMGGGA